MWGPWFADFSDSESGRVDFSIVTASGNPSLQIMLRSLLPLLAIIVLPFVVFANQPTASIEFQFLELDEVDYDVVREELLATRIPGDFEGLNRSQVPVVFWKKVETFPGAELLSAPKIIAQYDSEAKVEISDYLELTVICRNEDKGIGVNLHVKMETWKKQLKSNVTLPDNVQAMIGSLSNSQGRRVLVLCKASQAGTSSGN